VKKIAKQMLSISRYIFGPGTKIANASKKIIVLLTSENRLRYCHLPPFFLHIFARHDLYKIRHNHPPSTSSASVSSEGSLFFFELLFFKFLNGSQFQLLDLLRRLTLLNLLDDTFTFLQGKNFEIRGIY
jgi:hypothetical protein